MATYTLTGPSTGLHAAASTNFTVTMDATTIVGTVVVTPNDNGGGGTFTPATLSFTTASQAKTFTYTPATTGTKSIRSTATQSYVPPANLTYTVTLNKDLTINQLLTAWYKTTGKKFPLDEIVRAGGVSNADALTLRTSFETYYKSTLDRQEVGRIVPDKASQIHLTNGTGRSGRGGSARQSGDTVISQTNQTGR